MYDDYDDYDEHYYESELTIWQRLKAWFRRQYLRIYHKLNLPEDMDDIPF